MGDVVFDDTSWHAIVMATMQTTKEDVLMLCRDPDKLHGWLRDRLLLRDFHVLCD